MTAEGTQQVPVVVVGAGPTGVTVATLLAQYGVDCLVLDRWSQVYPQPRAVHLDDKVFRVLARLGIADEFATISRPALGLRLIDSSMNTLADYVLGCDGANSMARTRIGSHMQDLGFEQRWLVVDVATSADLGQWEGVHQVCDPYRAGTYMRIGETRYRWEFRLLDGETSADFNTLDTLGPLIRPWVHDVSVDELTLVRVAEYTFRAQLADRWRRGRIFLLGDAAHLTPPFIGQGMGAGVRDGVNLAWKLAGVLQQSLPAEVLDTYEQERKPHALNMIRFALGIGRSMTAGGDFGNLVRRFIVP